MEQRTSLLNLSEVLTKGAPFDITGFETQFDTFSFREQEYRTNQARDVIVDIDAQDAYLKDVQFWFRVERVGTAFGDDMVLSEMSNLIDSLTIQVDGVNVAKVDHARHLLSILQQRKTDGSNEDTLHQKAYGQEQLGTHLNIDPEDDITAVDHKDDIYRTKQEIKEERIRNGVYHGYGNVEGRPELNQSKYRHCLFKLSDLEIFKSFPMFFLKRGMRIRLNLNKDYAAVKMDVAVARDNTPATTDFRLYDGRYSIHTIKPDQEHIMEIKDMLMADKSSPVRFVFNGIEGNLKQSVPTNGSHDVSIGSQLITKSLLCFVQSAGKTYPFAAGAGPAVTYSSEAQAAASGGA